MKWSRYWALLAMLVASIFGGSRSADASAFLWISAPNWSYSAAAARCPIGFASFWGLSIGHPSFSFAHAFCTSAFGSSAAYAVAATRRGGAGAWVAAGFADPSINIGIPLLPDSTTPHDFGPDVLALIDGDFSDAYDVSPTGITFTSPEASIPDGTLNLAAYLYDGPETQDALCALFGGPAGCTTSTDAAGHVTTLTDFEALFSGHLTPLGSLTNPDFSSSFLGFNQTVDPDRVILVAQSTIPEPAALLLLAQGLFMLSVAAAVRRRRG